MAQTDNMIQTFEKILDDSVIKGISIFKNPSTRAFIKQYQDELSMPNAYKDIEDCTEKNKKECDKHMGEKPSTLNFDIDSLFLAHRILVDAGEADFEQIEWLK